MKPKKIKITPKSSSTPPPKEEQPKEVSRDTGGRSRLTMRKRGDSGYDQLAQKHASVQQNFQSFRKKVLIGGGALLTLLLIGFGFWAFGPDGKEEETPTTYYKYGIPLDSFLVRQDIVREDQTLDDILISYSVPLSLIPSLIELSAPLFDQDQLEAGSRMTVLASPEDDETKVIIYEPNPYEYTVLDLRDSLQAYQVARKMETRLESAGGIIDSVLWETILNKGLRHELIGKMEEALKWSVDLYHLSPGDRFKVVYEAVYADGEMVGIQQLDALYFQTGNKAIYAYYEPKTNSFIDQEFRPVKRTFLQAPVTYARISSPFNLNRYHPVLQKVKAHLGTDYAAPEGTPILAVADGVVSIARFAENNGNYVKIRHDGTYETQYLHMSEFAPGIKSGSRVEQGDIIGLVGSTGLSSGPHVCFRFWKNGKQVDHRAENLASPAPLAAAQNPAFVAKQDSLTKRLQDTNY